MVSEASRVPRDRGQKITGQMHPGSSTGEKLDCKGTRRAWGSSWVLLGCLNLVGGLCIVAEDSVEIPKVNIQQEQLIMVIFVTT